MCVCIHENEFSFNGKLFASVHWQVFVLFLERRWSWRIPLALCCVQCQNIIQIWFYIWSSEWFYYWGLQIRGENVYLFSLRLIVIEGREVLFFEFFSPCLYLCLILGWDCCCAVPFWFFFFHIPNPI